MGSLTRRFESVGDNDGDDLAIMPDPVRLQCGCLFAFAMRRLRISLFSNIFMRKDIEHTRNRTRGIKVKAFDTATRNGAGNQKRVRRICHRLVGRINRRTGNLGTTVYTYRGTHESCLIVRHGSDLQRRCVK